MQAAIVKRRRSRRAILRGAASECEVATRAIGAGLRSCEARDSDLFDFQGPRWVALPNEYQRIK